MKHTYRIDSCTKEKHLTTEMIRIVRTKDDKIVIDLKHEIEGRGSYLFPEIDNVLNAKKRNSLSKSLRIFVPMEIYDRLIDVIKREEK